MSVDRQQARANEDGCGTWSGRAFFVSVAERNEPVCTVVHGYGHRVES
ncbi:hypothetical protein JOE57_000923 [Microlunatus panaciterrae]|uniref:Uncharacterized protein n=1 Tax=Microlunatus panaciterrae TaxID=400768 RepID=A0ABS2RGA9_9ACTN|nr:hypothetical protein [Microlunatus panaciterrae]